jgi:hypothetical protein
MHEHQFFKKINDKRSDRWCPNCGTTLTYEQYKIYIQKMGQVIRELKYEIHT